MAERARVQPIAPPKKTGLEKILDTVERVGNKVPHPAVIFILLIAAVIILSHILYLLGFSATYETINPDTHQTEQVTTKAQSLLTADGIRFLYAEVVRNFMSFNAVGVIIVAMLGVGVAETSGLIKALIRKLVQVAPPAALTYILVFVGIVSSIAADAGYLVLIPLAAAAFLSVGRNPLVGLAASFAGVSAVFSVNILIKPLDGILTGITNDAIHLMNPNLSVSLTANFWFSVASVVMLTVVCGLITDKLIEPRMGPYRPPKDVQAEEGEAVPANEPRGLKFATWGLIAILALFALLTIPSWAPLRNPTTGGLIGDSPFMNGLIVFIALAFLVAGAAYGFGAKTMKGSADVIKAMEKAVIGLGALIFLLFFISQFIALFTYTNLATISAVKVGDWLETLGLGPLPLAHRVCPRRHGPQSLHHRHHSQVGDFCACICAAADEVGRASWRRTGRIPRRRFANQRDYTHDGLFPVDRRIRGEISERRRCGHCRCHDVAFRDHRSNRLDDSSRGVAGTGHPVGLLDKTLPATKTNS